MICEFADAPRALRLLHTASPAPEWIALVPVDLVGSDLEEVITRNSQSGNVVRYVTATKDVVYMGGSRTNEAPRLESHPSAFSRPAHLR